MPSIARSVRFWLSSTAGEQLSWRAADAGSKQAEAADIVNHSFTPSKLWGLEAEAGGSVPNGFFFFLLFSLTLKILSTPLALSAELFYPGPPLYCIVEPM